MRKIIFLFAILSLFASCSESEPERIIMESEFPSLEVKMQFNTDGEGPKGTMYLFYLSDVYIDDLKPSTMVRPNEFCYLQDVNKEVIRPKYTYKFNSDKDEITGKYVNFSTFKKYLHDYKEGDYLIVLCLTNTGYSLYGNVTSKKITISKSSAKKVLNENINTYEYLISLEKIFKRDLEIPYGQSGYPNYEEW